MSRLAELRAGRPGLLGRIAYFFARRKVGHVPEPLKVLHRNPAVLAAVGGFEMAMEQAGQVPHRLKVLAQIRAAMQVGCPF